MPEARPTCSKTRTDGQPCAALALPGTDTCYFHAEGREAERQEARRAGGRRGRRPAAVLPGAEAVHFASVADVTKLLAETATDARRGTIDPKVANTLGYLASVALRSLEKGDLEQRLAAVEAKLAEGKGGKP